MKTYFWLASLATIFMTGVPAISEEIPPAVSDLFAKVFRVFSNGDYRVWALESDSVRVVDQYGTLNTVLAHLYLYRDGRARILLEWRRETDDEPKTTLERFDTFWVWYDRTLNVQGLGLGHFDVHDLSDTTIDFELSDFVKHLGGAHHLVTPEVVRFTARAFDTKYAP